MIEDLEKKIKILERKLKLSTEALSQAHLIRKKYDEAKENLKHLNDSLEEQVLERTKKIQEQHKYFQAIINGVENPIMVIKEDYTIEVMNTALQKSIDYSLVADKEHPKCYEVSHKKTAPCDGHEHPCPLEQVLKTRKYSTVVHKHYDISGGKHYVELAATPLYDNQQNCIGIIESARDITEYLEVQDELREQKSILQYQAHHDFLTGLPNRVLFDDRLHQLIEKGKRNSEGFALFFIDLDRFKQINDSLGHRIGDEVLKEVSLRIGSIIRADDTLCRIGGDEFTILMDGVKKLEDASNLSQKILKILSKPLFIEEHTLYVSSSIGISLFPQDGDEPQNLIKYADVAMYKAKELGRNTFQFYSSTMTDMAIEYMALDTSLRQALENNEFIVYYQPQVNATINKLIGMEALIRWQHPTKGLLYPTTFLPMAEENGLILEIDKFVIKSAMTQLKSWYDEGYFPGILALNLSTKQLEETNFVEEISTLLYETGCQANWIELEITESHLIKRPEETIKVLNRLAAMGIELAVDDFGTGYSSLSYLKRLPIDKLKIDQSFVKNLPVDDEDMTITKAVISLSKSLNLKLIAEGVEREEQKTFLVNEGCDNIQGYYYSRPLAAEDFRKKFLTR